MATKEPTGISKLEIHKLTQKQYDDLADKQPNALYLTPDNSFSTVTVGKNTLYAATKDNLTLKAGDNVTLTPDVTNNIITIGVPDVSTSKNVITDLPNSTSNAASTTDVYINHVENETDITSSHKISGSGGTTVTADESGNIIITSSNGVGKNVAGNSYEYNGKPYKAGDGAEVFNCYDGDDKNMAIGQYSHTEGYKTVALDFTSHAEGFLTESQAYASHAEGYGTKITVDENDTLCSMGAHAEGHLTEASAAGAHVEGSYSKALAQGAHAEGFYTEASGKGSHAEGYSSKALTSGSHSEGTNTMAGRLGFTPLSCFFDGNNTTITLSSTDGLEIGMNCSAIIYGNIYYNIDKIISIDTNNNQITVNSNLQPSQLFIMDRPDLGDTDINIGAHVEGYESIAAGNYSHAEGNDTVANGEASHTEGQATYTITTSKEEDDTVYGESLIGQGNINDTYRGKYAHAEGYGTVSRGCCTHSEGHATEAYGHFSHAEGCGTLARGNFSHAAGYYTTANERQYVVGCLNKSMSSNLTTGGNTTTENTALFLVGNGYRNAQTETIEYSNAFRVTGSGNCYASTSANASGADFAEFFEWFDGNSNNEDRRGLFVKLNGDKIELANINDDYIGIISSTQAFIGNTASEEWHGRYLIDIFGNKLTQTIEVPAKVNEETGEIIEEAHTETQYIINPDYDPNQEYISREYRKEWGVVGLLGQIVVVDDGTCVPGGYVKPSVNGIGTASTDGGYRVMKRLDENHIKVFVK